MAGCQPPPKPFQPTQEIKERNPLLQLADGAGVLVRPVVGLNMEIARKLSSAIVSSLISRNIPAYMDYGNRGSLVLSGMIKPEGDRQQILWRLNRTDINISNSGKIVTDAPPANSSPGGKSALLLIADRVGLAAATHIQKHVVSDRSAAWIKKNLHITFISGAPEAAAAVLRNELEAALRREGLIVSDTLRNNSLLVSGTVSLSEVSTDKIHVTVNWILSLNDGSELGNLNQDSDIAPIELDEDWPRIARNIADSAAIGLRLLLNTIQEKSIEHAITAVSP